MVRKIQLIGFCALLFISAVTVACSRTGETDGDIPTDQPAATHTSTVSTPSLEPKPTSTPTSTPEPTPISPHVIISDQSLDESGELIAGEVALPGPGWLAIYRSVDGEPGDVIGRSPLVAGVHENIKVTVDIDMATEQLFAGVHMDAGTEGVFDFPGEDEPYPGEPETEFNAELLLPRPQIEVAGQAVAEDGIVTLARVELMEPTWILIHTDIEGEFGPVIGGILVDEGIHENVTLPINWRRATSILHAVLHKDDKRVGIIDFPDGDLPILSNGKAIVSTFDATYPPEVLVYDQPVIDGTVSIERAISNGPGWVAVYNEVDGQPGFIIGSGALQDGLNEAITVRLVQSALTEQLFARIHHDTEAGDAFNFPAQDPAVVYNNRLPNAAAFRTDIGGLAYIQDQRLASDNSISVSTVVSSVDGWATIYTNNDGQPGDLLGQVWFPIGISRNFTIALDPPPEPGTLFLVLFQDLGESQTFEIGIDPLLDNDDNRPIRIPFTLLSSNSE